MHANILVTPQEGIARSWDTLPTHQVGGLKGIAPVRAIHGMLQHACNMPMKEVLTRFVEHVGHKGNKHEASTDEHVLPAIALEGQRVGDYQLIHRIGQGGSANI